MPKIPGKLIVYLNPNGTVRIVFAPSVGGGNDAPFLAKDLDTAEICFMTCGLTPERAAALRAGLERNKVASVEASIDEEVAAKFRREKK